MHAVVCVLYLPQSKVFLDIKGGRVLFGDDRALDSGSGKAIIAW
jgi:hypothetical protein